ncbi:MAG: hypothetical protein Q8R82_10030, partial [Hyphomonadaceae bacterium]|nr:hypothetical protein [Hyphomonadaceae bacterium]
DSLHPLQFHFDSVRIGSLKLVRPSTPCAKALRNGAWVLIKNSFDLEALTLTSCIQGGCLGKDLLQR